MNIKTKHKPNHKKYYVLYGGGGFIGTNICDKLLDPESKFLVIDNASSKEIEKNLTNLQFNKPEDQQLDRLLIINENITIRKFDLSFNNINFNEDLRNLFWDWFIEVSVNPNTNDHTREIHFINLASVVGVDLNCTSHFNREMRMTQNIIGSIKDAISGLKVSTFEQIRVWYTSSSEVYGNIKDDDIKHRFDNNTRSISLTSLYSPDADERSHYIYQKILGTHLFEELSWWVHDIYIRNDICHNIGVNVLVLFNVVGPTQDPKKGVFNKFIHKLISGFPTIGVSATTRRYIPIDYVIEALELTPINKIEPNNYNVTFVKGTEHDFCGTGEELFRILQSALYIMYPDARHKIDKVKSSFQFTGIPEIKNRFESNYSDYTVERFIENYGHIIRAQVQFAASNGWISADLVGGKDRRFSELVLKSGSEAIDIFGGKILEVNAEWGLIKIIGFTEAEPGTVVATFNQFDKYKKEFRFILSNKDEEGIWTGVLLGRELPQDLVGKPLRWNSVLQLPQDEMDQND